MFVKEENKIAEELDDEGCVRDITLNKANVSSLQSSLAARRLSIVGRSTLFSF
jgi:hypothetical protein